MRARPILFTASLPPSDKIRTTFVLTSTPGHAFVAFRDANPATCSGCLPGICLPGRSVPLILASFVQVPWTVHGEYYSMVREIFSEQHEKPIQEFHKKSVTFRASPTEIAISDPAAIKSINSTGGG